MSEYKKCPYCGEEILAVAKKCKYCREWLTDDSGKPLVETTPAISQMEQIKRKQEIRQKDSEQRRKEQDILGNCIPYFLNIACRHYCMGCLDLIS